MGFEARFCQFSGVCPAPGIKKFSGAVHDSPSDYTAPRREGLIPKQSTSILLPLSWKSAHPLPPPSHPPQPDRRTRPASTRHDSRGGGGRSDHRGGGVASRACRPRGARTPRRQSARRRRHRSRSTLNLESQTQMPNPDPEP